jgi:2-oxoglutarate ferredoxin oxidoreductase subunit gamma
MKKSDSNDRYEIRLSGSGGQGLVLAGVMLAEAVGVYEGKNVAQTQSYGPEARGGSSRSDITISTGEIYYPKTSKLDLLLCLTQDSCDKYYHNLKEDGVLIIDSDIVRQPPPLKTVYSVAFHPHFQGTAGDVYRNQCRINGGQCCHIGGLRSGVIS